MWVRLRSFLLPKTAHRLAVLTLIDQGLSSVSNFAVGVVIARVVGASGLGGFALAYGAWLILAVLHRSLITDPMAISGDVRIEPTIVVRSSMVSLPSCSSALPGA